MSKQIISLARFRRARISPSYLLIATIVLVTGLTASALAWLAPAGKLRTAAAANGAEAVTPGPAMPQEESRVKVLVVVVRPGWLEPAEVTLPAGDYLLVVQNRSGLREVTFRLDREAGGRLHEARERRRDWSKQFRLTPGVYLLTEADHPELSCRINITPQ